MMIFTHIQDVFQWLNLPYLPPLPKYCRYSIELIDEIMEMCYNQDLSNDQNIKEVKLLKKFMDLTQSYTWIRFLLKEYARNQPNQRYEFLPFHKFKFRAIYAPALSVMIEFEVDF